MENIIILGLLLCLIAMIAGLFMLIFKKGKRLLGAKLAGISFVLFFGLMMALGTNHARDGFPSVAEKELASEHGIKTPEEWNKVRADILAQIEQAKAAKVEAERQAEAEKQAAAQRAKEEEDRKIAAAKAADEQEERRKGFHCLSAWDGSHRDFARAIKQNLRDPDSFEHVETRVTPVGDDGTHKILMTYRARNGFGGMNVGEALGTFRNDNCDPTILTVE